MAANETPSKLVFEQNVKLTVWPIKYKVGRWCGNRKNSKGQKSEPNKGLQKPPTSITKIEIQTIKYVTYHAKIRN